jgi:hypothetical protein
VASRSSREALSPNEHSLNDLLSACRDASNSFIDFFTEIKKLIKRSEENVHENGLCAAFARGDGNKRFGGMWR